MEPPWDYVDDGWGQDDREPPWEAWLDEASQAEFLEREMSYADAVGEVEEVATDEGGWGAWMGGEM